MSDSDDEPYQAAALANGRRRPAQRACPVCQSDAIAEDALSGALVCSDCGTQLADHIAEQHEAAADMTGTRYKRRPAPSPAPVDAPDADATARGPVPHELKCRALQHILQRQLRALAALYELDEPRLHGFAGEMWFRLLASPSDEATRPPKAARLGRDADAARPAGGGSADPAAPARRPLINLTLSLGLCYLAVVRAGAPLLLSEVVGAAEAGRVPFLGAYAQLPPSFGAALRGRASPLRPSRLPSDKQWRRVLAWLWRVVGLGEVPMPPRRAAALRVARLAALPAGLAPLAVASEALVGLAVAQGSGQRDSAAAAMARQRCESLSALCTAQHSTAAHLLLAVRLAYVAPASRARFGLDAHDGRDLGPIGRELPPASAVLEALAARSAAARLTGSWLRAERAEAVELAAVDGATLAEAASALETGVFATHTAPSSLVQEAGAFQALARAAPAAPPYSLAGSSGARPRARAADGGEEPGAGGAAPCSAEGAEAIWTLAVDGVERAVQCYTAKASTPSARYSAAVDLLEKRLRKPCAAPAEAEADSEAAHH